MPPPARSASDCSAMQQADPGRHYHSTAVWRDTAIDCYAIDCHSLGIYIVILVTLLSYLPK